MEVGKRTKGSTKYIPEAMLTESTIGAIYELQIKTEGVDNPQEAINIISSELPKKFKGLEVLWARVDSPYIKVQIKGSPFVWSAVLLFLPQILATVGIIVALIAVYLIWSAIPSWAMALLIIGGIIIWGAPKITKKVTP